jgi:hypothetical protein
MWLLPTEARWAVCVYNAAAIILGYGISIPVQSAKARWNRLARKNSGRSKKDNNNEKDM